MFLLFVASNSFGQTGIIYQEDFGSSCTHVLAQNYVGESGSWTIQNNFPTTNQWYVSAKANGNIPGECASGCNGDASLHVSYCGDIGAYYSAGSINHILVYSPMIDVSEFDSIQMEFDYLLGNGNFEGLVLFFDGVNWLPIDTLYSTQGECDLGAGWAHHNMNLPVTGSGDINFKIGFSFRLFYTSVRSYDIGSVAIDDIVITGHALVQDETPPVVICPGAITLGCEKFQSLADLIEVSVSNRL